MGGIRQQSRAEGAEWVQSVGSGGRRIPAAQHIPAAQSTREAQRAPSACLHSFALQHRALRDLSMACYGARYHAAACAYRWRGGACPLANSTSPHCIALRRTFLSAHQPMMLPTKHNAQLLAGQRTPLWRSRAWLRACCMVQALRCCNTTQQTALHFLSPFQLFLDCQLTRP